jgi:ankyrin repeat protein
VEHAAGVTSDVGISIRQCDRNCCNAYHLGCVQGYTDVVKFLVEEAGLDMNECEGYGGTGLGWALKQGHADLAQWLRQQGALPVTDMAPGTRQIEAQLLYRPHTATEGTPTRHVPRDDRGVCL